MAKPSVSRREAELIQSTRIPPMAKIQFVCKHCNYDIAANPGGHRCGSSTGYSGHNASLVPGRELGGIVTSQKLNRVERDKRRVDETKTYNDRRYNGGIPETGVYQNTARQRYGNNETNGQSNWDGHWNQQEQSGTRERMQGKGSNRIQAGDTDSNDSDLTTTSADSFDSSNFMADKLNHMRIRPENEGRGHRDDLRTKSPKYKDGVKNYSSPLTSDMRNRDADPHVDRRYQDSGFRLQPPPVKNSRQREQFISVPSNAPDLSCLLSANRRWAESIQRTNPQLFQQSVKGQNPKVLWIGCADSRIPVARITGVGPGELFVHRNVANLCLPNDLNLLSTLTYAVDHLKVEHIVVAGHYECGGVAAALSAKSYGLIDHWIKAIKDVCHKHRKQMQQLHNDDDKKKLLVRLNVMNSVQELGRLAIVQNAWKRKQMLKLHGWVYRLEDGILEDLRVGMQDIDDISPEYRV